MLLLALLLLLVVWKTSVKLLEGLESGQHIFTYPKAQKPLEGLAGPLEGIPANLSNTEGGQTRAKGQRANTTRQLILVSQFVSCVTY